MRQEEKWEVSRHGFAIVPAIIHEAARAESILALGAVPSAGKRGILELPAARDIARSERLLNLVRPHLGADPIPVRGLYFDKSPNKNWAIGWHQDLTICVRERIEVAGFGAWTVKVGVIHVQPPVEVLRHMLTVRIHFDDADESNGVLRVLPGSHHYGRLSPAEIREYRAKNSEFVCEVSSGDVLLMKPLLLHASGRSTNARHRRVLHLEYAAQPLPGGLQWDTPLGLPK